MHWNVARPPLSVRGVAVTWPCEAMHRNPATWRLGSMNHSSIEPARRCFNISEKCPVEQSSESFGRKVVAKHFREVKMSGAGAASSESGCWKRTSKTQHWHALSR